MSIIRASLLLICIFISFQETLQSDDGCEDPVVEPPNCERISHLVSWNGYTCCNGSSIQTIEFRDTPEWEECLTQSEDINENYTTTIWRVYTCFLMKNLKDKKTITLTKFAELRLSNVTSEIKEKILGFVSNVALKPGNSTKPWLTAEINLSDLANIDKIRAEYFNIERKMCGDFETSKGEESRTDTCSSYEEESHRGGYCCGNKAMPITLEKDHFAEFDGKTCNKTLKGKMDSMGLRVGVREHDLIRQNLAISDCYISCYLAERNVITMDQLNNMKATDEIDINSIVDEVVPCYFSNSTRESVYNFVEENFCNDTIMEVNVPNSILGDHDKVSHDDLYGCIAYGTIYSLATKAFHHQCWDE